MPILLNLLDPKVCRRATVSAPEAGTVNHARLRSTKPRTPVKWSKPKVAITGLWKSGRPNTALPRSSPGWPS